MGPSMTLDTVPSGSAAPEVPMNDLLEAFSPAGLFGVRPSTTGGLYLGYYGGLLSVDGVITTIADGTVLFDATSDSYIEADRTGAVSANTTGFTPGRIPLWKVSPALGGGISSITPYRALVLPLYITREASVAVTGANVTLTQAQAACDYLTTTGILTGDRSVIVPDHWRGDVFCNNTGAYTTTFKTGSGTGEIVAQGKRAPLRADGTNVIRMGPDT